MDLFVTLNVATFKNILCIPIVCKYFIFIVSMAMREKSKPCCLTLFEVKRAQNYYLEILEIMKEIIANLITIVQNYYATS
jgi:hypothetical protein